MTDPNVSAKIEGCTEIITNSVNHPCKYCGAVFVHTFGCMHNMVNQIFRDLDIFWPWFPARGPYTTFDQHYGGA